MVARAPLSDGSVGGGGAALRRLVGSLWATPARRLALVFVVVPLVVFGVPAAFGVPVLVGDNLIQNYPLRALVGTDLIHGHLPLWDPYLWSGSPLLAGFNAGAAYPLTWLFAVLPHLFAFVVSQAGAYVVAALGMVTFLRLQGRSFTAAGLGAAAFSYGGFMAMQSVHLDLVTAGAWLVWAFVAVDRLARRPAGTPAGPWVALLGAALGLMVLSGAAEPLLDGGVALGIYALWLLLRTPGRRLSVAVGTVGGAALGAAIGAAQLLPGSLYQAQSQRALHTYQYFTSGSMNKSLTILGLDPLVLGGAHHFPLSYVGTYNLPEISSYVGIVPVMGLVGLLARRHRRHPEASQWWIWYVIGLVGLLLAWGSFTPLGHLEYLVPLYNRQRLLVRNLLEVDLAVVVLFAAWVDHMLLSPSDASGAASSGRRWTSDVVLPLLPVAAVVGLQVVVLAGGPWFPHFLHVPGPVSYGRLWPLALVLSVPSAIAVYAGTLVVRRHRLGARLGRLLVVVVAADMVVFNAFAQADPQVSTALDSSNSYAAALVAATEAAGSGPGGELHRVAIFDPDRFYPNEVNELGQPDLTILRDLRSVQGYGAIVDARYDNATGTHLQGSLTPSTLTDGTMSRLDLGVLVTVPENFVHLVVAAPGVPNSTLAGATPLPPVPPDRAAAPATVGAPPTLSVDSLAYKYVDAPPAAVALVPGQIRTQYFGTVLAVSAVHLPLEVAPPVPGSAELTPHVRVGLLGPKATAVHWLAGPAGVAVPGDLRLAVPGAPEASGLVVEAVAPPSVLGARAVQAGQAVISTAGQGTYRVDGGFRDIVAPPQWRFAGMIGVFCVFVAEAPAGRAYVTGTAGTARVLSDPPWGTTRVEVTTTAPGTLVRSESYASGWQATIDPAPGTTGPSTSAAVVRRGLVQAVAVPAGTHVVTFRYRPHRVVEGLALSGAGVLVALALALSGRRGAGLRRRAAAGRSPAGR